MLPALKEEAKKRQRDHGGTAPGRPGKHFGSLDPECSASGSRYRAREEAAKITGAGEATVARVDYVYKRDPGHTIG